MRGLHQWLIFAPGRGLGWGMGEFPEFFAFWRLQGAGALGARAAFVAFIAIVIFGVLNAITSTIVVGINLQSLA